MATKFRCVSRCEEDRNGYGVWIQGVCNGKEGRNGYEANVSRGEEGRNGYYVKVCL